MEGFAKVTSQNTFPRCNNIVSSLYSASLIAGIKTALGCRLAGLLAVPNTTCVHAFILTLPAFYANEFRSIILISNA